MLSYFQKFKTPGFYTLAFYTFIKSSKPRQNKNNPEYHFVDIIM